MPLIPFQTTLEVRDHCLCFQAQRAARALARRFDRAFAPYGLTNQQFSLLMSLNRPAPPSIGAVAETLGLDRTSLTAALKPLVRRGLALAAPDPANRRSRLLTLTVAGTALLVDVLPVWRMELAAVRDELPPAALSGLRQGLAVLGAAPISP